MRTIQKSTELQEQIEFTSRELTLPDGRRLSTWSAIPRSNLVAVTPVVIGSGFARRMHSFAPLALYLAYNGLHVIRYDSVNHVGLSDGEIDAYKMSDGLASLRAVIGDAASSSPSGKVALVATSLTARLAYEMVRERAPLSCLLTVVGVVNLAQTLHHVFGLDLFGMPFGDLPNEVVFEGKRIGCPPFVADSCELNLETTASTTEALRGADLPLIALVGTEDKWVDSNEVRQVLRDANMRRAPLILELDRAGHDLSVNASVGREVLRRSVLHVRELLGVPLPPEELREPSFEDIVNQSIAEKRIQRADARGKERVA
jgi:acyl transferase